MAHPFRDSFVLPRNTAQPPPANLAVPRSAPRLPSPPRRLRFDERLARASLASINSGPDGLKSLRASQCNTTIYEVTGQQGVSKNCDAIHLRNAEESPLLCLPKELRERIFEYAVSYDEPIPIRLRTTTSGTTSIIRRTSFFTPPLLLVCSQYEQEAATLYYASNTFSAEVTDGNVDVLLKWLRETPKDYLSHMRELHIALEPVTVCDVHALREREQAQGSEAQRALAHAIVSSGMDLGGVHIIWLKTTDVNFGTVTLMCYETKEYLLDDIIMLDPRPVRLPLRVGPLRFAWLRKLQDRLEREKKALANRVEGTIPPGLVADLARLYGDMSLTQGFDAETGSPLPAAVAGGCEHRRIRKKTP